MEKIEYGELVRDTKVLHISTQTTSSILLNGSYKSKASYDVRGYLNFENDDSIEYITMQMPYAVMCNSNYIVNENNNILSVTTYAGLVATTNVYTFTLGNYNLTSFTTALGSFLSSSGFSISSSAVNNRFIFTNASVTSFQFNAESTCDYIIGFSGLTVSNGISLTCSRSYNFLPIPRFVLHCNILNDGIILGTNSSVASSDILATIPNVSRNNGQIVYENSASEFLLRNLSFDTLTISITDDNNRLINFNGISSYFVLKFNIFRRNIKKPMKFSNLVEFINKVPIDQIEEEPV